MAARGCAWLRVAAEAKQLKKIRKEAMVKMQTKAIKREVKNEVKEEKSDSLAKSTFPSDVRFVLQLRARNLNALKEMRKKMAEICIKADEAAKVRGLRVHVHAHVHVKRVVWPSSRACRALADTHHSHALALMHPSSCARPGLHPIMIHMHMHIAPTPPLFHGHTCATRLHHLAGGTEESTRHPP